MRAKNVVLGAGSMGLATAYHLAKRGEPVLLVEQFTIGHDRGSSHGVARIIRHSYDDSFYAKLMPSAFAEWREFEAMTGEPIYLRTGGVSMCSPSVDYVAKVAASLEEVGVPHRRMSGREWNASMPVFSVANDQDVVFEPDAGILLADRALKAMLRVVKANGASVLENAKVQRIDLDSEHPKLILENETIETERLIVTAGPWTGALVPELASKLQPERQQVLYFAPENPEHFSIGSMPIFISVGEAPGELYYGMPSAMGSGVKVARHGGEPTEADSDDREIGETYRNEIRGFLRANLPRLAEATISKTEICKYTIASNDDFVVGVHPGHSRVLVASPCSGHGFKFSCLIGRVLSDLTLTETSDIKFR